MAAGPHCSPRIFQPRISVPGVTTPSSPTTGRPKSSSVAPNVGDGRAGLAVDMVGPGMRSATCTFTLWQASPRLDIEWVFDKVGGRGSRERLFCLPVQRPGSSFLGDFNGIPCEPDVEQLPGSVKSWYPVQGWVGVDGSDHSVVLVPLDAPLVHLGGVNTGRVVEQLDQGSPVIMSWALNNHWFVNFKAQQDGRIRLRYSLTSMPGHLDVTRAMRFSAEVRTPPVVLRDRRPFSPPSGAVGQVLEGADLVVGSKVSEDGTGLVAPALEFQERRRDESRSTWAARSAGRGQCCPDEREEGPVQTEGSTVSVVVGPRWHQKPPREVVMDAEKGLCYR